MSYKSMAEKYGLSPQEFNRLRGFGNLLIKTNPKTGYIEHINKRTGQTLYVDKNTRPSRPSPDTEVKPPKTTTGHRPPKIAPTGPPPEPPPPKKPYKPPPGYNKFGQKITEVEPPKTTWGHPPPKIAPVAPSGSTKEGFALARTKRKPKEEKGVLMTDKDTEAILGLRKTR